MGAWEDLLIQLLEFAVVRTWEEEKAFSKTLFGRAPKANDSLCQAISRGVFHKVFGLFPEAFQAEFLVNEKPHVVLCVPCAKIVFVVDGTIKQFLPEEKRTVFMKGDYPFNKEMKYAKRRII